MCGGMDQVDLGGEQLLVEQVPGDGEAVVRRQECGCSIELGGGGAPAGDVDEPPPHPADLLLLRHRPGNSPLLGLVGGAAAALDWTGYLVEEINGPNPAHVAIARRCSQSGGLLMKGCCCGIHEWMDDTLALPPRKRIKVKRNLTNLKY